MLKTRKRWISLIVTLAMLVTFCVPFAGPAAAGAASYKPVTSVPTFDPGSGSASTQTTATVEVKIDPVLLTESTAQIEVLDGDGAILDIKSVKSDMASVFAAAYVVDKAGVSVALKSGADATIDGKSFTLKMTPNDSDEAAKAYFYMIVDAKDCAAGDIKLNVFSTNGKQLDEGSVVVAKAAGGAVTASLIGSAPKIGEDSEGAKVSIRLKENSVGAINVDKDSSGAYVATDAVKIKLPAGFEWSNSGLAPTTGNVRASVNDRILTVTRYAPDDIAKTYDISATVKIADSDTAKKGDVVATIEGVNNTSVTPSELTVAKYTDYGVNFTVASVKELVSGRLDEQKTDKIKIEELIANSIIDGRTVTIKLPDWVKIVKKDVDPLPTGFTVNDPNDNKITISVKNRTDNKAKIEFKLTLSIEADRSGDIEAVVSGAGIAETTLVVAKALPVVSVTGGSGDVKIGVQDQAAPDITITEANAGALIEGKDLLVVVPEAKFSVTPKVEVTEGDLEIKTSSVKVDGGTLTIPIKSESLKASTIKISGVKLTLDRTVPEGPLTAKIKGPAAINNDKALWDDTDASEKDNYENSFTTDYAVKFVVANCVTRAPDESKVTAVLTANNAVMKVNGKDVALDAAPYIKNDRLYVSARFCANAFGVANQNIIWDGASKSATIMAGARVIQMKVGSNLMVVNGASITMDTVPEIVDPGRVMLPIGWLAQALGASAEWDQATQTATLQL